MNTSTSPKVKFAYDDFGRPQVESQAHAGTVATGTPKVQYAFSDGSAGHSRLTKITYPNGRELSFGYTGDNDGLDRFGRVADLRWRKLVWPGDYEERVIIRHGYDRAGNRLWCEDPEASDAGVAGGGANLLARIDQSITYLASNRASSVRSVICSALAVARTLPRKRDRACFA